MADHYCALHDTVFFKKGGMKGFAHPILDENNEPTGKWCNEPKADTTQTKPEIPKPEMSKEDWAEKDRATRKSIERQTALNCAVEVAKLLGADKGITMKIIVTARLFETYLEKGELIKGKIPPSKLIEEVKKLGANEVEPGDIPY